MDKRDIEKNVNIMLERYGYSQEHDNYIDIVDFVRKLGFSVGSAELEDNDDGFLIVQPNGVDGLNDRIIGVNSKRSYEFKRFIIAHEFAHFILHYKGGSAYLHRENKKGKNEEENEADYYAANLIMPKNSFLREYNNLKNSGLENNAIGVQLASIYKVPLESALRRISEVIDIQAPKAHFGY
ncbi:MAG TPA: ImmA/IrrE family metallo-endopeptidase [Candidatus Limousia pullorum]|uniref:ImmA/IrrE family metallo-endopeptidase n=1 Tax=Candidatus Limousia pullorum TaxID=2840860 RepID=A0A9D1LZ53_9FIRM|nr:ImmA/IrrE family metallo-endopeptidase [Candidatus Limousia pullorum]